MASKNFISTIATPANAEAAHTMPDRLSLHLGFVLNRAAQQMRETFETALEPLGIKPRHYGVMSIIAEAGPLPQHVIGEKLNCDRNTMVAVVDDLENAGLAKRAVHPDDRRAYAVGLTPAGRRMLEKARAIASTVENGFLAPLTPKQQGQLHQLLKLLLCREGSV